MQGTAPITMADTPTPSPEDTAKTIASIEAQLDDLLDAVDHHEPTPAPPAPLPPKARQASAIPTQLPAELDDIADALDAVAVDDPAALAAKENNDNVDANEMLAEVNDALAGLDDPSPTPTAPTPIEAQETSAEPVADLDAEMEALLAEESISDEVLAAAQTIAKDDEVKAEADHDALAHRAQEATQNLMSQGNESAEELLGQADAPDFVGTEEIEETDDLSDSETQEQIALEIENLLAAEGAEPTPAEAAKEEPSIDQIDQMLADEIHTDDELVGDFQSVDDIADGIVPSGDGEAISLDGEPEGASADDVASELDSQPENAAPKTDGDNTEDDETAERKTPRWKGLLKVAELVALRVCWMLNWPLRQKPVTPQWRSTVGYVALLNLAIGSALFGVGLAKLVF